eukprot:3943497-Prymnesium_polylepis.1
MWAARMPHPQPDMFTDSRQRDRTSRHGHADARGLVSARVTAPQPPHASHGPRCKRSRDSDAPCPA